MIIIDSSTKTTIIEANIEFAIKSKVDKKLLMEDKKTRTDLYSHEKGIIKSRETPYF